MQMGRKKRREKRFFCIYQSLATVKETKVCVRDEQIGCIIGTRKSYVHKKKKKMG